MAVQPIAVLHGPQDCMPSPDALVDQLESSWAALPSAHRVALRQMFAGSPTTPTATTTATATTTNSQPSNDQHPSTSTASSPAGSLRDGDGGGDGGSVDFRAIVSYNAYGDEYEDLPAADLRGGGPPQSHVGLWPHFNNLNHSCAPNCVHYVVGSTMVVRAVQAVPEGSELFISYLGRDDLAPRQVRQAVLQSRYGFRCDCARCRTEEELPEELQSLLQQLYDRARHELAPRFERLASAASAEAAEGLDGGAAGAPYGDQDDDDEEDEFDAAAAANGSDGGAATPAAAAAGALKVSIPSLTAAERAKRALRKGGGGSSPPPPGLGSQLTSLESRLEECARQLHLAVQELQEEDEVMEELGTPGTAAAAAGSATAVTPSPTGSGTTTGRQLTRVQAAQAAAYQLLELLHLHAELAAAAAAGGGGAAAAVGGRARAATGALQACWHVLDAISRGSELQVFQACKLLSDALAASGYKGSAGGKAGGKGAPPPPPDAVREAAALLGQSLLARYGPLRGQQLTRMTQAAIRTSRGFF